MSYTRPVDKRKASPQRGSERGISGGRKKLPVLRHDAYHLSYIWWWCRPATCKYYLLLVYVK